MSKVHLYYISDAGLNSAVFDSQVINLLINLQPSLESLSLIVLQQKLFTRKALFEDKLCEVRKKIPNTTVIYQRPRILRAFLQNDAMKMLPFLNTNKVDVIHCHGVAGAYTGLILKEKACSQVPLIADLRGIVHYEFTLYSHGSFLQQLLMKLRAREFLKMEQFVTNNSDFIFCVSQNFKQYIIKNYNLHPDKFLVVPTLVNTDLFFYNPIIRNRKRREMNLDKKIVFVYSGSVVKWQLPEKVVQFFISVKKFLPEAFLLFITHNIILAKKYLATLDSKDYYLISLPHTDIPSYLNAADIGIILREDNIVNRVACPTKFGEYLTCGLPVVITHGIGDTEDIVTQNNIGKLVRLDSLNLDLNDIKYLINLDRNKIANLGRKLFSIDTYKERILDAYHKLSEKR